MTSAMTRTMTKTHTKTNTKTKTKTNTKCLKDPSHAIFLKSREFKDIKYDTNSDHKYKDKDKDKDNMTKRPSKCYIFMGTLPPGSSVFPIYSEFLKRDPSTV